MSLPFSTVKVLKITLYLHLARQRALLRMPLVLWLRESW